MTQSAKCGPEKPKGYWQTIQNICYQYTVLIQRVDQDSNSETVFHEVMELRENHPTYGQFFSGMADILEATSTTYNVSLEEIEHDIDIVGEMYDIAFNIEDL